MKKILIIDDDTYICTLLEKYLKKEGFFVEISYNGKGGIVKLKKESFDVVLCDFRLPDTDGKQMLIDIKALSPSLPVIIITGYSDVRVAVSLIKSGAFDYVTKPIFPEEILNIIKLAIKGENLVIEQTQGLSENNVESSNKIFMPGASVRFNEVIKHAEMVAPTDMSVLIHGETGAGKEYIARTIHEKSKRKDKPFIAVDCGAIPKDIANSELFGHVKGSFTGAINNKEGYFEAADGGTLFLDEVGNLSYEIQVKLLRALQEKVISKVGDNKSIKVDIRLIAATNEDIPNAISSSSFREDLYHRINEFMINLPPLRERKEDILPFANFFLNKANEELNKDVKEFDPKTQDLFINYSWPGNLRELKNVIKRAVLISQTNTILPDCLPEDIINFQNENRLIQNVISDSSGRLKNISIEAEKEAIFNALFASKYNKSKAAELLNIDRKTLYNKIKQYNIDLEA